MDTLEKKKAAPPYVAYKTLSNFLDRFKQGVPARIDRGLMASMSGAAQSQVTTALKYLGMITENGIPTDALRGYVSGQEVDRRESLAKTLISSYPFLFGVAFDLAASTASQLREAFEANTSATGETLDRCISFFKDAASDAGIIISPYITQKKARVAGKRKSPARKEESRPSAKGNNEEHGYVPMSHQRGSAVAQESMLLWGLFQRLPKPRTTWSQDDREQWLQTLRNVLVLEYPEV